QNESEMNDEQRGHRRAVPKYEQYQSRQARQQEQSNERFVESALRRIEHRLVASSSKKKQTGRTGQQPEAAGSAEHDRKAEVGVRRPPAEPDVVERRDRRRREAQHETVKGEVMEPATPPRSHLFGARAVDAVGVQVLERDRIAKRTSQRS